jgi:N-acetylglucosaminyldiphosphoundecaprenol N-acetyl-beta-D-mannosaminyltransferase
VVERAHSGLGGYACLTSVHGLVLAQRDAAVRSALGDAWMNFPDGVPITWVQHRRGAAGGERVCGIDLMPRVFDAGRRTGLRHYLYGSTDEVLDRLERRLARLYPGALVVGRHSPSFGSIADHARTGDLDRIRASDPDVVWVGLGAPKQDLWAQRYAAQLSPALVMCVGAAFDFVAETKRRAPMWMQTAGLEWVHRLALEPRRLAGRYARANTEFVARIGYEMLSQRLGREPGQRSTAG